MIEIRQLNALHPDDLNRLVTGYTSNARYNVTRTDSEGQVTFTLQLVPLPQPYLKQYDPVDAALLDHYRRLLPSGFSFGAYDRQEYVGLAIAEARAWNQSLWVLELHVAGTHRRRGIGGQLLETVAQKGRAAGLRTLVCETQNTNVPAIRFYRKLGLDFEGIDLSYYSNADYPDGEIAVFLKKRLGQAERTNPHLARRPVVLKEMVNLHRVGTFPYPQAGREVEMQPGRNELVVQGEIVKYNTKGCISTEANSAWKKGE